MIRFGGAVATLCTTPGITKRMWPDAERLLRATNKNSLADDIVTANLSAFPKYAKREFDDTMTKEFMYKQLEVIGNMILAAQLMPDDEEFDKGVRECVKADRAAFENRHPYFDYAAIKDLPPSIQEELKVEIL
jgi:hypothetical protein